MFKKLLSVDFKEKNIYLTKSLPFALLFKPFINSGLNLLILFDIFTRAHKPRL